MFPTDDEIRFHSISDYNELLAFEEQQLNQGIRPIHVLPRRLVFTAVRRGGLAFGIERQKHTLLSGVVIPGRLCDKQVGWIYLINIYLKLLSHAKTIARLLLHELQFNGISSLLIPVNTKDKNTVEFWKSAGATEKETLGNWYINSFKNEYDDTTVLYELTLDAIPDDQTGGKHDFRELA